MKLPPDAIISERKLREYLLTRRNEDDKFGFLALAGYGPTFWRQLVETDIRQLIHDLDAELVRKIPYGDIFKIMGLLIGSNGRALNIVTIWITLNINGKTRFVTLFRNKEIN